MKDKAINDSETFQEVLVRQSQHTNTLLCDRCITHELFCIPNRTTLQSHTLSWSLLITVNVMLSLLLLHCHYILYHFVILIIIKPQSLKKL